MVAPGVANCRLKVILHWASCPYGRAMIRLLAALFALPLAALAAANPAAAQAFNLDDVVKAEILPGWRAPDGRHFAALHLTMAPGWKTYWRVPGAAGIPPEFTFAGSDNLASVTVHWPVPHVFSVNGLTSIGYSDELVLPLEVAPVAADVAVQLHIAAEMGVCKDICVPLALALASDLEASGAGPDPVIETALASRPTPGKSAGLAGLTCSIAAISDGLQLTATMTLPDTVAGSGAVAAVELDGSAVWTSPPVLARHGDRLTLTTDLVPADGAPFALNRSDLRFTILSGGDAVEFRGCPAG